MMQLLLNEKQAARQRGVAEWQLKLDTKVELHIQTVAIWGHSTQTVAILGQDTQTVASLGRGF